MTGLSWRPLSFQIEHAMSPIGHETDMPKNLGDVRCWVNSGKHLLSLSFFGFDPTETSNLIASEAKLGRFFLTDHSQRC
jgi:hypothetical protein